MGKISSDGKIPKRIGDFVTYPLNGDCIIRRKSGFTQKGMAYDPKYTKSRENSKEFGAVSRLCKVVRIALKEILPKSNNLAVCNRLTAVMQKIMNCDETSERGNRSLKNGFKTAKGKALFAGYDFNPSGLFLNTFKGNFNFDLCSKLLHIEPFDTQKAFVFPEGANCVGLRMGLFLFDFDTSIPFFKVTEWSLFRKESRIDESLQLGIRDFPDRDGVVFYLLEIAFFVENQGCFIPFEKQDSKVVFVLGVE
jgi:hypothetical protein